MAPLTTLIFPDTRIKSTTAFQLSLFFQTIHHYLPAEPPAIGKGGRDQQEIPPGGEFCHGYPPVPLGEELENFNQTIRDLQVNIDDYGNRLHYLSLASSPLENMHGDNSVSSLVSELRQKDNEVDRAVSEKDTQKQDLWQARIILKLAETLAEEQEEIQKELSTLAHCEKEMLSALKGDGEESPQHEIPLPIINKPTTIEFDRLKQRLKAWVTLFLTETKNNQEQASHQLLTANGEDVFAPMAETYEDLCKSPPMHLFSLPLPTIRHPDDATLKKCGSFRAVASTTIDSLQECIEQMSTGQKKWTVEGHPHDLMANELQLWAEALRQHFQPSEINNRHLAFYSFPGISLQALLTRTFLQEDYAQSGEQDCLMAVLST